jgi:dTMP kinase
VSRGFFCVLEGVDGSGKTGAITYVESALKSDGLDVVLTREPGGTEEGLALRKLLLSGDTFHWTPMAELLLVNASRAQHVEKLIRPAVESGKIVLCDRFVGSTIAYQGAGRGIAENLIRDLHRRAIGDYRPDLTIVLDIEPHLALERSRQRLKASQVDEGRFEALDLAFHRRVRQSFLDQAAVDPKRHVVIDASGPQASVQEAVLRSVRSALRIVSGID